MGARQGRLNPVAVALDPARHARMGRWDGAWIIRWPGALALLVMTPHWKCPCSREKKKKGKRELGTATVDI